MVVDKPSLGDNSQLIVLITVRCCAEPTKEHKPNILGRMTPHHLGREIKVGRRQGQVVHGFWPGEQDIFHH